MNNRERQMWIDNDEGLYLWWKSSRQPMAKFIKENREEIDSAINNALHPPKQEKTWQGYCRPTY